MTFVLNCLVFAKRQIKSSILLNYIEPLLVDVDHVHHVLEFVGIIWFNIDKLNWTRATLFGSVRNNLIAFE